MLIPLQFRAEEAGITVMNEVGVDPGIDHMLAIQCFENVEEHGGKVILRSIFCSKSKLNRKVEISNSLIVQKPCTTGIKDRN